MIKETAEYLTIRLDYLYDTMTDADSVSIKLEKFPFLSCIDEMFKQLKINASTNHRNGGSTEFKVFFTYKHILFSIDANINTGEAWLLKYKGGRR